MKKQKSSTVTPLKENSIITCYITSSIIFQNQVMLTYLVISSFFCRDVVLCCSRHFFSPSVLLLPFLCKTWNILWNNVVAFGITGMSICLKIGFVGLHLNVNTSNKMIVQKGQVNKIPDRFEVYYINPVFHANCIYHLLFYLFYSLVWLFVNPLFEIYIDNHWRVYTKKILFQQIKKLYLMP